MTCVTGLSKADKIKFIHSTASCYGTSETQNTISGGSAKFIETVSSGRNTATITFTFREPARGNDGALAAVHACYLFAGSSQYTGVEGIAIKVGAPDEFAPAWARMHTDGTDPFQIWQS